MNVFVLNKHGEALMPCKPRKAKLLLREENYTAQGMQNKGAYLKFTDGVKSFVKNMKQISIVFHQNGIIYS
jgi:hypothetical protein